MKLHAIHLNLFLFCFLVFSLNAQDKKSPTDSLFQALKQQEKTSDEYGATCKAIAKKYLDTYDFANAATYARKGLSISENNGIDSLAQQNLLILGLAHIYQGNTDSSLIYMKRSTRLALSIKDSSAITRCYGILSNIHNQYLNQPEKAFLYIDSAERYYRPDEIKSIVFGKIVKGSIFFNVSAFHLALEEFYAGLDLSKDDSIQITSLHNNIGLVYERTGDYKNARKHQFEAIRMSQNNVRSLGIAHHNLAHLYHAENNMEKMIVHEKLAIKYLQQFGVNYHLLQAQLNTIETYHDLNMKTEAFRLFETIQRDRLSLQDQLLYSTMGAMIEYPGFSFQKTDQLFKENREHCTLQSLMDVSFHIYSHFKDLGNENKALYYLEVRSALNDSLLASDKVVQVQRINLNRIVNKKNKELQKEREDALKAEHKLIFEEEKNKRWKYVVGLLIAVGLLAAVLVYEKAKNRKKTIRLQAAKITKEQKRRALLLNRLEEVKQQLKKNIEMTPQNLASQADSSKTLMDNLNDRNWPNFLSEFELVYPYFFKRLEKLTSTTLSKNERRLCCLIKLHLSNKEIAEYVFVSPDSVKKARNRLSKKFALTDSQANVSNTIRNI